MNTDDIVKGIYLADRGLSFKDLIVKTLGKGNIKQKYVDILTSPEGMEIYGAAFTSELVDEENNYQVYEQLGDLSGNKFIVYYIYDRFPQLRCAEGVKVAARLRINLGSKNSFCSIGENYGFWDFISATNDLRQRKKKPLLEDVFEAFLGATEYILDQHTKVGVGYACVYKILKAIFDDIEISLKYEDLYDAKTRLKELFDIHSEILGPLRYEESRDETVAKSTVFRLEGAQYAVRPDGSVNTSSTVGKYKKIQIGQGSSALKADAEQAAAQDALKNLARHGYVKYAPAIYSKFASANKEKVATAEKDVLKIVQKTEDINSQFFTRGKSKYQNKYTSTALGHYARKRDVEGIKICMKMGADPCVPDSDGMTPLDGLFIGPVNVKRVKKCSKLMLKWGGKLTMNKNVRGVYFSKYVELADLFKGRLDVIQMPSISKDSRYRNAS